MMNMKDLSKCWFVEYSLQQKCYYYEILSKIIERNHNLVTNRKENGYVIIGGPFETIDDATKYHKKYQEEFQLPQQ